MANQLFLSFWKLSVQNLPVGRLVHKLLDSAEAKTLIEQAQQTNSLVCTSCADLLAPYNQRNFENQQELCQVLQECFDIQIAVKDFLSSSLVDGKEMLSVTPLELAQIKENANLMIVTCHYSLPALKASGKLEFQVVPDSVEFHLLTTS